MAIYRSSFSGIPFGNDAGRPANPQVGQPYFNGQSNRLEIYTQSVGWQNIVQETPAVVNVVGNIKETTSSSLTINGTNFAVGCIAYAVGTNGVEYQATTTSLVSVVQLTATWSNGLSSAYEPYDVKVVNPSNLYGILYDCLNVDANPIWTTGSGSLGTYIEQSAMSVQVSATDASDPSSSALIYSISSGSLPPGLSINSATGVISGTPGNISSNTTYSFTASAYDGYNPAVTRNFSITVTDRGPTWVTSATLPTFTKNSAYSTTLSATDEDGVSTNTYSLFSGSLPTGLSLSSGGVISGTPTSSTNATFTIRATDSVSGSYTDRQFTMTNAVPVWTTSGTISAIVKNYSYSYQLVATDDSGVAPTYSLISGTLPTGISFSSSGLISGTATAIVGYTNTSFTFRATDSNGGYSDQSLTIPLNEGLYAFSSFTFTPAGASGRFGPTLSQIQTSYSSTSWTQSTSNLNMTTQGKQIWTVPLMGSYSIACYGARGGMSTSRTANYGYGYGGSTTVSLTIGQQIEIVAGQVGGDNNGDTAAGGGGGASYARYLNGSVIIVGSGGGGNSNNDDAQKGNGQGNSSTDAGGLTGVGNTIATHNGGGGGGWTTNGQHNTMDSTGEGIALTGTAVGGDRTANSPYGGYGGFGGGGRGGQSNGAGGGGGGYQGGDGGHYDGGGQTGGQHGCGGYCNGVSSFGSFNTGNGYVTITKL